MEPLRVGLAGLNFGKKLALSGTKNRSIQVVACYSRTAASREKFAAEFGCTPCESYNQMLEHPELEAVIVATPNHNHLEQGYEAAVRGKHVFVDKPITNSIKEGEALVSVCRDNGVKLCVGHSTRFSGSYTKIRELVQAGRIGQPLVVEAHFGSSNAFGLRPGDWRWSQATCPSQSLIQMGIHLLDVMRATLGEVVSVSSHFENVMLDMDNPDLSATLLEFESGATGVLVSSYIHNDCYSVWHGSEGLLRYMYWVDDGRIERLDKFGHVDESDHWIDFEPQDSLAVELKDFQGAVREDREPIVNGEEGLRSLAPVLAAVISAREGRRVYIDELL
ncbi:Gfo/Idh/MocA family oxidoreductase [bacterium]|nr:Gfo/Idh/MocA family oxidoreductase [bacterium]